MCGIAGYSLGVRSRVDRTLAAQALLAAIADRGSDAVGYAYREGVGRIAVHKQRTGASELLEAVAIPTGATQALLHVRDYTKGHPSLAANNHPIRHGPVVGIHNGVVANDEEIFERFGFSRAEPGMTVDSEAIFALVERAPRAPSALEEVYGSMAAAWIDERIPDTVFVARGVGRPLWVGEGSAELVFASTQEALELVERYVGAALRKRELPEGSLVTVTGGRVLAHESFAPDRTFAEQPVRSVRAPGEQRSCLERLAVLAAGRRSPARAPLGVGAAAR